MKQQLGAFDKRMDMIKIKIEEGEILINNAWISFNTPSLIIIEIDCKTKYPEMCGYSDKDFWLVAGEHTLHKGTDPRPTRIELELPEGFRINTTRIGRYTVEVYCVNEDMKNNQESKIIWSKE